MRTKRVEYDKGLFIKDEALEKEIDLKAKEFVNDILDNVGKDYAIHDLEPIIVDTIISLIAGKAIDECAMLMGELEE